LPMSSGVPSRLIGADSIQIDHRQFGPGASESARDLATNAACRAGHDGHLVFEAHLHGSIATMTSNESVDRPHAFRFTEQRRVSPVRYFNLLQMRLLPRHACHCAATQEIRQSSTDHEYGYIFDPCIQRPHVRGCGRGCLERVGDLPVDAGATYELGGGLATIDVPDAGTIRGYRVESHNRSDDVWMYLVRSFGAEEGILPGQAYSLSAELAYVTTAASGWCSR